MGEHLSKFRNEEGESISSITHPSKKDWIVTHASLTKLAIVEVDRLWIRFEQLGCDADGCLDREALRRPPASTDIFTKNVLNALFGNRDRMTFLTFLNAMKWAETARPAEKLSVVFSLLQNGDPVSKDLMFRVLKRTYPDDNEQNIKRLTEAFMKKVDDRNQGFITEEQFINAALKVHETNKVLDFHIVPTNITEEAHKIFSMQGEGQEDHYRRVPSSELLASIARQTGPGDTMKLANQLGFSMQEMIDIETKYQYDRTTQVEELLKEWRRREGTRAQSGDLARALRAAGMYEAAQLL